MTDLTSLIERIRGLTGPDRDVDGDIFEMFGGDDWRRAYAKAQEPCGCPHETAVKDARRFAPRYTDSLDASERLRQAELPEGLIEVSQHHDGFYAGIRAPHEINYLGRFCRHPSEPIARVLAVLIALHGDEK